jgi:hypothetical protein
VLEGGFVLDIVIFKFVEWFPVGEQGGKVGYLLLQFLDFDFPVSQRAVENVLLGFVALFFCGSQFLHFELVGFEGVLVLELGQPKLLLQCGLFPLELFGFPQRVVLGIIPLDQQLF